MKIAWLAGTALLFLSCKSGPSEPPESTPPPTSSKPKAETEAPAPDKTEAEPKVKEVMRLKDVGFKTPESVLYDPDEDVYLVSNINGDPLAKDGNGFISKVSPEGKVLELEWIKSPDKKHALNAPKGSTLAAGKLWVADIDKVVQFDRKSGKWDKATPLEATFLNDMATGPADKVYVSDTGMKKADGGMKPSGTASIWALGPKAQIIKGPQLENPNGLYHDGKSLWAVTFGGKQLYRIDSAGKKADAVDLPKGSLDGIVGLPDGSVLISSWEAQAIYHGPTSGPFEPIITGVKAPADIGYDSKRNRVLIPLFMDNAVAIYQLP